MTLKLVGSLYAGSTTCRLRNQISITLYGSRDGMIRSAHGVGRIHFWILKWQSQFSPWEGMEWVLFYYPLIITPSTVLQILYSFCTPELFIAQSNPSDAWVKGMWGRFSLSEPFIILSFDASTFVYSPLTAAFLNLTDTSTHHNLAPLLIIFNPCNHI